MSEIAISVQNISKVYKLYGSHVDILKEFLNPFGKKYHQDFYALKDVSFEVKKGETVGIIGENGSGKSTILQIIAGVLTPTNGHVIINGKVSALLELGTGFNPELTGIENIYFSGMVMGLSEEEIDSKIDNILSFADIGEFVYQPVKTYSSGMYVRLAFSIFANIDPEVFIVDEALAVGDAYFIHRCMLRFHELQKQGKTILFVSHDADAIKRLCKRALWINQGAVMMLGDSSEVVDNYLAFLFKQPLVEDGKAISPEKEENKNIEESELKSEKEIELLPPEEKIPNIDRRLGDQNCSIVGVALYNESMEPVSVCPNDSNVILRMTIRNNTLSKDFPMIIGHIVRDHKGIEIASTNSEMEKVDIPLCSIGETITVRQKISLPILYPGTYSISPTTAYMGANGDLIVSDRIENAIVFELTSSYELHVLMKFKTEITVEEKVKQ